MPRMLLCGRRINQSSDDFVFASGFGCVSRAALFSLAVYYLIDAPPPGASGPFFPLAVCTSALFGLCIVVDVALCYFSSLGTPLEPRGREPVPHLLTVRVLLFLAELVVASLALSVASVGLGGGSQGLRWSLFAFAIVVLVGAALSSLGYCCLLGCSLLCAAPHLQRSAQPLQDGEAAREASQRLWTARWSALSLAAPGSKAAEALVVSSGSSSSGAAKLLPLFSHMGAVASHAFEPLIAQDLTIGDALTGIALFSTQQQQQYRRLGGGARAGRGGGVQAFNPQDALELRLLKEAAWYSRHVYAAYAGIATVLDLGGAAPCCLAAASLVQAAEGLVDRLPVVGGAARLPFGGGGGPRAGPLLPCTDFHAVGVRTSLCLTTQCTTSSCCSQPATPTLVHSSPRTGVLHLPWAVLADRDSLVVCLRGTLHLEDLMTDAAALNTFLGGTAEGEAIAAALAARHRAACCSGGAAAAAPEGSAEEGLGAALDPAQAWFHTGMWLTAVSLRKELEACKALELARGSSSSSSTPTRGGSSAPLKLVIVGHSLGAGVAAALALQLLPSFPTLHCFSFAPPTAVASPHLAQLCAPFVTSVALGRDIVLHLSVESARKMVREAVGALRNSGVSKARAQLGFLFRSLGLCLLPWECRVALGVSDAVDPGDAAAGSGAGGGAAGAQVLTPLSGVVLEGAASSALPPAMPPPPTPAASAAQNASLPMAMPGRVLHLELCKEGPSDYLTLGLSWAGAVLCAVLYKPLFLLYLLGARLLCCKAGPKARASRAGWDCGWAAGDALAAALWMLGCVSSWRVKRTYRPRWVGGSHFAAGALEVSMRGMVEHLPHCYVAALGSAQVDD